MTAEVVIEHCRLRVVRSAAWPWGPERDDVVRDILRALPQLIAEELARLVGDDAEGELNEPLALSLSIGAGELAFVEHGLPLSAGPEPLANRVFEAVRSAVSRQGISFAHRKEAIEAQPIVPEPGAISSSPKKSSSDEAFATSEALRMWHGTVVRALLRYRELGGLAPTLAVAPPVTLAAWHAALRDWRPEIAAHIPPPEQIAIVRAAIERTRAAFAASGPSPTAAMRIFAMLELIAARATPASLWCEAALEEAWMDEASEGTNAPKAPAPEGAHPSSAVIVADMPEVGAASEHSARAATQARATQPGAPAALPGRIAAHRVTSPHLPPTGDVAVESILPFIALVPLARMGFLDALDAVARAAGADTRDLAAAFAYKLLPPPLRGWHRSPSTNRAAAAFAGIRAEPSGELIADAARKLEQHLGPVDDFLSACLADGHTVGAPLLLTDATDGGVVLVDCEGLFPVAWAPQVVDFPRAAKQLLARELVLIPDATATAEHMAALDHCGARFVTDAPPAAGDDWRRIGPPQRPLYTNDRSGNAGRMVAGAQPMAGAQQLVATYLGELATRPAVPRAGCALERTLTLAAAVGLGAIAWTLWRDREAVDPSLALERLTTLDGRVGFTSSAVTVRMPMGKRHQDLYRHGFTNPVAGVPWLEGRDLVFSSS